jgi:segregation and condensation protein B
MIAPRARLSRSNSWESPGGSAPTSCTEREAVLWRKPRPRTSPAMAGLVAPGDVARRSPKMARLEAALFVADAALSPRKLALMATLADATEARTLISRLNQAYESQAAPFRIEQVAAGYRLLTRPQFAFWLGKLHHRETDIKLSPPALETLTVVAYRQPITRAEIEAIRGVQCSEMIRQLMDRGLVRIGGEDNSLGRPFLYETTRQFLEVFGLRDVENLPLAHKLRRSGTVSVAGTPLSAVAATSTDSATSPQERAS